MNITTLILLSLASFGLVAARLPTTLINPYRNYAQTIESVAKIVADHGYRFRIIVFAWKRRASLKRLINPLMAVDYRGFNVTLQFYVDGGAHPQVIDYIHTIEWTHGPTVTVINNNSLGLEKAVMDAWQPPADDKELAIFFEDDIEPSTLFFDYLLTTLSLYLSATNPDLKASIAGVSLLSIRFNELVDRAIWTPQSVLPDDQYLVSLFLFQLPSSWGALFFPEHWRGFQDYYKRRLHLSLPEETVPNSFSNKWQRSWKKYLIEYMVAFRLTLIYPNLPMQEGFSTHWKEPGEHTKKQGVAEEPQIDKLGDFIVDTNTLPLVTTHQQFIEYFLSQLPSSLDEVPVLDYLHTYAGRNYHEAISKLQSDSLLTMNLLFKTGHFAETKPKCIFGDSQDGQGRNLLTFTFSSSKQQLFSEKLQVLIRASQLAKSLNRCLLLPEGGPVKGLGWRDLVDLSQVTLCDDLTFLNETAVPELNLQANVDISDDCIEYILKSCNQSAIKLTNLVASSNFLERTIALRDQYQAEWNKVFMQLPTDPYYCLYHSRRYTWNIMTSLKPVIRDLNKYTKEKFVFVIIEPGSMASNYSLDSLAPFVITMPPKPDNIPSALFEEWEDEICSRASLLVGYRGEEGSRMAKIVQNHQGPAPHFFVHA